jgi:hypothetical protein
MAKLKNMERIPTAKELFDKMLSENDEVTSTEMMIEFARIQVTEALIEANKNATIILSEGWIRKEETIHPNSLVDSITIKIFSESILNSYPLENIK